MTGHANFGAERLAELLMDLGSGDAAIKRRLHLELAAANGSADVTREVKKRLATIAKAQSFIEWPKIKQLAADLELQWRTIVEQVAIIHPAEALALMWQFLALANALGDVDGFIAQYDEKIRAVPVIAAEIAQRLLAAGRVEEAATAIDATDQTRPAWIPFEWEASYTA